MNLKFSIIIIESIIFEYKIQICTTKPISTSIYHRNPYDIDPILISEITVIMIVTIIANLLVGYNFYK